MEQPKKAGSFLLLLLFGSLIIPSVVSQSWNCSTGTSFCVLSSTERRSWHEASTHCYLRNGGLAHSDHLGFINVIDRTSDLWIGLGWVNGRLQWMSHIPQEERNSTVISYYASQLTDPAKFCHFMSQKGNILNSDCKQRLLYWCVKPVQVREDSWGNTTVPNTAFVPELIPSGKVRTHSPFVVVQPSAENSFRLDCSAPGDALTNCSYTRIRWLKGGAYIPDVDDQWFISDEKEKSVSSKTTWISRWIGRVTCEIVCFSSGEIYRSKEEILVLEQSVALRVEFQFLSKPINIMAMAQHFREVIQPKLSSKLGKVHLAFNTELPFLSRPEESTDTFSFYAYHLDQMNPQEILNLTVYLHNVNRLYSSDYWLVGGSAGNDRGGVQQGLFSNIKVTILNYCLEGEDKSTLVFANQPTFGRGLNSHFRNETMGFSECHYASQQCKVDWFLPARMEKWKIPLGCIRCMADFHEHQGRCLQLIRPQTFSKSIAQCMAEYQLDQIDSSWNLSNWVRLSLDWINENKAPTEYAAVDLRQIWLPVQRRTDLESLRPIWPWNFAATNSLQEGSLWEEEMKAMVNHSSLREDWSQLDPSMRCLILDTQTRTLKSASCQDHLPMICVRPRLKLNDSTLKSFEKNFAIDGQCPSKWMTTSLAPKRNYCYRIFGSEVGSTFDEAEQKCQKHGGQLAVASAPSTLAVLLSAFSLKELVQESDLWIGLKKNIKNAFQWTDKSSWTYQSRIKWSDGLGDDQYTYGVSLNLKNAVPRQEIHNSRTMQWKRWPKEATLTGFICQKVIFPQPQVGLQINLNKNYQPVISMQPVLLHSRQINGTQEIPGDTPLKDDVTIINDVVIPSEPIVLSKLTCFLGNSTFSANYQTSEATANYEANFNVISTNVFGTAEMKWRAAEVSCETWDTWSTERLQASWIMKTPEYSDSALTSFIVRLRHLSNTYAVESHDATFKTSVFHRTELKFFLDQMLTLRFTRHYRVYRKEIMSAHDPVAFEPEPSPRRSLLVKYRIVLKPDTNIKRQSTFFRSPGPIKPRDDISFFYDLHKFLSSQFNSSYNNLTYPGTVFDFVSLRSPDYCPSEITTTEGRFVGFPSPNRPLNYATELLWPKTNSSSATPTSHCVTQDGHLLRRQCLGDRSSGRYWESLEQYVGPLCFGTSLLFQQLLSTLNLSNTSQILQTISQVINGWNPVTAEVELLVQSLFRATTLQANRLTAEDLHNLLAITEKMNALETDTLTEAQQSPFFSSKLSRSIEVLLANIDTKEDTNYTKPSRQRFEVNLPFMAAGSWIRKDEDKNIFGFSATTDGNAIIQSSVLASNATYKDIEKSEVIVLLPFQQSFPPTLQTGPPQMEQVTFVMYQDTRLVDASAASGEFSSAIFLSDPSESNGWRQSEELFTGNGGMVQVHLSPQSTQMVKPVTLLFRPRLETTLENRHLLRCVFWDEKMNSGSGGWSIDGCWHEGTRNGLEVCRCNHLSTFTLLVSRSENDLQSTIHGAILNVITLIGSILSIVGLSLILLTFLIFPSWRTPQGHKLIVHLSLALISLLTTFIVGVDNFENAHACRATAIFLHYFLLAAFCWMTVEAYYQYQRLVIVFQVYIPRFLLKVSILAWGTPLIPIFSVLLYDVESYTGDEGYCWLRPTAFYLSALLPIAMLLMINLYLFALLFRSIAAIGQGLRTNQSERKQAREKLIACLFNFILLGLSWSLGFFAIGPTNSLFYSYMFCLTTTLQGFFLFVFYVVRDPQTRRLWTKLIGFDKCSSKNQSDSKSAGTSEWYVTSSTTQNSEATSNAKTSTSSFVSAIEMKITPVKVAKVKCRITRGVKPGSHRM